MRSACLLCLVVGCGFTSSVTSDDPAGPAGGDDGSGPGGSGGPVSVGPCDRSDNQLRLCLSLDQSLSKVQDLISASHTLADNIGVTQVLGIIDTKAAQFDDRSRVRFAENHDFDVPELTIEMWIAPAASVSGPPYWLLDNNTQYYAVYEGNGQVRCGIGGGGNEAVSQASFPATLPASWHHVACTYAATGGNHELRVYVDGNLSGCNGGGPNIPQGGHDGVAIGANFGAGGFGQHFFGGIRNLHLYSSALSPSTICGIAGGASCNPNPQCPGGGDGGDHHGGR